MIDAVMYGVMPSAKIVRRQNVPPENRSMNPKNDPVFCQKNASNQSASTPGVGMWAPRRYIANSPRVNRTRFRRSENAKYVGDSFEKLVHCLPSVAPVLSLGDRFANHEGFAARRLDLLFCRGREKMSGHGDGARDLAVTQYLQTILKLLHDSESRQSVKIESIPFD